MKNIQVIDGAENCVFDIFSVTEEEYKLIFIADTDIAFIDEVQKRCTKVDLEKIFKDIWRRRVNKKNVNGIHGTLFYELENKKKYYPDRKDELAINPNGSLLR